MVSHERVTVPATTTAVGVSDPVLVRRLSIPAEIFSAQIAAQNVAVVLENMLHQQSGVTEESAAVNDGTDVSLSRSEQVLLPWLQKDFFAGSVQDGAGESDILEHTGMMKHVHQGCRSRPRLLSEVCRHRDNVIGPVSLEFTTLLLQVWVMPMHPQCQAALLG